MGGGAYRIGPVTGPNLFIFQFKLLIIYGSPTRSHPERRLLEIGFKKRKFILILEKIGIILQQSEIKISMGGV